MSRTTTEIFAIKNWKYFIDSGSDAYARIGFPGEGFPFFLQYENPPVEVFVDGEGLTPVKNTYTWDMGDGTVIVGKTATHFYAKSGSYNVKCFFVDTNDNLIENSFFITLDISDFVTNNIKCSCSPTAIASVPHKIDILAAISQDNVENILKDGYVSVKLFYDRKTNPSIKFISDAERKENPFSHLIPSVKFLTKNETTSKYSIIETTSFVPTKVYYTLNENLDVVLTENIEESIDKKVVGLHVENSVYVQVDQVMNNPSTVWVSFDAHQFASDMAEKKERESNKNNVQMLNMFSAGATLSSIAEQSDFSIMISANGIIDNPNFAVGVNKFKNNPFPVVISIVSQASPQIPALYLPKIQLQKWSVGSGPNPTENFIKLSDTNGPLDAEKYDIFFNYDCTPNEINGGFSSLSIKIYDEYSSDNKVTIQANINGANWSATVYSDPLTVWGDTNIPDIRKINENYNLSEAIANYRTQQVLINNATAIFDDLIPAMLGDGTSEPNALGRTMYEKVSNMTMNHYDIDAMETDCVSALAAFFDEPKDTLISSIPSELKRNINLLSTQTSVLYGGKSVISEDFNDNGYSGEGVYGKNKGDLLDYESAIIVPLNPTSPQTPGANQFVTSKIIAYEKFSKTYITLNPYRTIINSGVETIDYTPYSLKSAIPSLFSGNPSDGSITLIPAQPVNWKLVLPIFKKGPTGDSLEYISKQVPIFYQFYLYKNTSEGTYSDGLVDFSNENTRLLQSGNISDYINSITPVILAKNISDGVNSI